MLWSASFRLWFGRQLQLLFCLASRRFDEDSTLVLAHSEHFLPFLLLLAKDFLICVKQHQCSIFVRHTELGSSSRDGCDCYWPCCKFGELQRLVEHATVGGFLHQLRTIPRLAIVIYCRH